MVAVVVVLAVVVVVAVVAEAVVVYIHQQTYKSRCRSHNEQYHLPLYNYVTYSQYNENIHFLFFDLNAMVGSF